MPEVAVYYQPPGFNVAYRVPIILLGDEIVEIIHQSFVKTYPVEGAVSEIFEVKEYEGGKYDYR